ncbi:MAG: hypothetical protein K1X64_18460 [Myxococcaceae bacterium]|nr:hypothetical protein [Myxococcaceae bacterium]
MVAALPLSPTRQLRRIHLALRGSEPTLAEYQAVASLSGAALTSKLDREIDAALSSPDFYEQMVLWGHEYLRNSRYNQGTVEGEENLWFGGQAGQLDTCPSGTANAGAFGIFSNPGQGASWLSEGDPVSVCDDVSQAVTVEPWWAPGTTVKAVGRAGNGRRTYNGRDCGILRGGSGPFRLKDVDQNGNVDPGCGCGPNLIYCIFYPESSVPFPAQNDGRVHYPDGQRRLIWEEPARLFAHIITHDKPFSDLVLGDYTVTTSRLQHAYVRSGRPFSNATDADEWWRVPDTKAWREVKYERMNPLLLAQRDYTFDPRTQDGFPLGVPSAGVLTTFGTQGAFARERVKAARWLETLACRVFSAPDPKQVFNPFKRDVATEGSCQHCHQTLDPTAIHFKRQYHTERGVIYWGGLKPWPWDQGWANENLEPFGRWQTFFIHDTWLTPVTEARLNENPNARFIDFLPPEQKLFGQTSDGTIGPLGFAKMLVNSGEFDRCAVQRIYSHFASRALDPVEDKDRLNQLIERFKTGGRQMRPFIRALMKDDELGRGL